MSAHAELQDRPQLDLPTVATGEIWYGSRALDLHLVDEVTTSDDYLLSLRPRAEVFHLKWASPRPSAGRLTPRLARAARLVEGLLAAR